MTDPELISPKNPYGVLRDSPPYPEECVFTILAGKVDDDERPDDEILMGTGYVVARNPEAAKHGFLVQVRKPGTNNWAVFSCVSLADLRKSMSLEGKEIIKLEENGLAALFSPEITWLVEDEVNGERKQIYVRARWAKTVYNYLKEKQMEKASFFPLKKLKKVIRQMEDVRDGDMRKAFYATDFSDEEEVMANLRESWKTASPEKRKFFIDLEKEYNLTPIFPPKQEDPT